MQMHPSANQIASPGSSRYFLLVAMQDDPLSMQYRQSPSRVTVLKFAYAIVTSPARGRGGNIKPDVFG